MNLYRMDRVEHTSSSGIETVETWVCEPYEQAREVQRELTGSVSFAGKSWSRKYPARDPQNENCFCVETLVTSSHPDAMASSEELTGDNTINKLEDVPVKLQKGTAGAVIRATYRPLITAWKASEDDDGNEVEGDGTERWDWIDPIIRPGVRQIPWPPGLLIGLDKLIAIWPFDSGFAPVPDNVSNPLGVSVSDFSIRRMYVGEIPWDTIAAASNSVNGTDWPGGGNAKDGLPEFKARTLKFIGADVQNMMDVDGNRWYELQYNFEWVQHYTDRLFDKDGKQSQGWVTWNHIFYRPRWNSESTTGWYEVWKGEEKQDIPMRILDNWLPGLAITGGRLFNDVDFSTLFDKPAQ